MFNNLLKKISKKIHDAILSVPVRVKIIGIILLPVIILGLTLNYWVTTGLSDWLSYLLTDVRVRAAMTAGGRSVLVVTILAAMASILLAFLLAYILTRPLIELREMAQKVAGGQLETRAKVWAKDEIGELATSINIMTDRLVASQESLTRTNRRLDAINRISLAADQQSEIHNVLYVVLETILDVLGLQTGWTYLRDPEVDQYHLASWYGVPPALKSDLLHQAGDKLCSCQQDLLTEQLGTEVHIRICQRLGGCPSIPPGSRHVTIPIEARNQRFGVINLLLHEERSLRDDELELLTAAGTQVSEIVANAWLNLKLVEKEAARQTLLESLVRAQEDERGRLARELHDGAGQTLTGLLVKLKAMERKAPGSGLDEDFEGILDVVSETIEQIRDLSYRLRPAALDELGLPIAIETLVQEMAENAGLTASCQLNLKDHDLMPEIEFVLYRITQEGMTNIIRHARAHHVEVALAIYERNICLTIEDDGRGFSLEQFYSDENASHLGLISMRERAEMLGGTLDVYSAPGQGTTIQAKIPILESEAI
ncbi:MAG TPA: HAMP domain-containing protein [Anaerolineales bacterium]|nr:HAMP domain-containing protein [Anaerolineales bacterium]